jgi:hypothetical protein
MIGGPGATSFFNGCAHSAGNLATDPHSFAGTPTDRPGVYAATDTPPLSAGCRAILKGPSS